METDDRVTAALTHFLQIIRLLNNGKKIFSSQTAAVIRDAEKPFEASLVNNIISMYKRVSNMEITGKRRERLFGRLKPLCWTSDLLRLAQLSADLLKDAAAGRMANVGQGTAQAVFMFNDDEYFTAHSSAPSA